MASPDTGAQTARDHALAVLRSRSTAVSIALLPAAFAVVLLVGGATGSFGADRPVLRWTVGILAAVVLSAAAVVAAVVARARPAVSPTVPLDEESAPELYRLVRDLADRLDVPAPSALALTPDCDSWLEDRNHPAQRAARTGRAERRASEAPVLVIGSPFLWWMRVAELRAVLAPVVAGTGPSAHPDIAAARRYVRGLDAAAAVAAAAGRPPAPGSSGLLAALGHRVRRPVLRSVGWVARLLLRGCGAHVSEMERGVAAAASARAQSVDYGLRIVAQEQVGLAYAGWDRLLTRVALPAWRTGRWPCQLNAGVVAALTELSRRDRLAEGFASRLGERPACDLLEEPGAVDEATSLLAAQLFHGGGAGHGPHWAPVCWSAYPEEVVDRIWRTEAARLFAALDATPTDEPAAAAPPAPYARPAVPAASVRPVPSDAPAPPAPHTGLDASHTYPEHSQRPERPEHREPPEQQAEPEPRTAPDRRAEPEQQHAHHARHVPHVPDASGTEAGAVRAARAVLRPAAPAPRGGDAHGPTLSRIMERLAAPHAGESLAARIGAELAREEAAQAAVTAATAALLDPLLPGFPPQPPRSGRELLAEHVTAAVCCAATDTAAAVPGLDWLDGPVLLLRAEPEGRAGGRADLARPIAHLVEDGDPRPLRDWLAATGMRPDKPVRLV